MQPLSVIELADVPGKPKARMALPVPLRVGDRLALKFKLQRQTGGRTEVLTVDGEFRVGTMIIAQDGRQTLSVESVSKAPSWKAVKKPPARVLSPAVMSVKVVV